MTFVFEEGDCIDRVQYFMNKDLLNFDDAQAACVAEGGKLAIPSSVERFERQMALYNQEFVPTTKMFLGLRDFEQVGGTSGTRFFTIDGEFNELTSVEQGESIWKENQPSGGTGQFCGQTFDGENLDDGVCEEQKASLCEKPCFQFSFDECIDDIQFFANKDLLTFDEAQAACVTQGGKLAIPSSLELFQRQMDLYRKEFNSPQSVFLGLRDFDEIGGTSGTRFLTIDQEFNALTAVEQGESIWKEGEPSGQGQNCGATFTGVDIDDDFCTKTLPSLCQRQCLQFGVGECINGLQYFSNSNLRTFDEAQDDCVSQGGKLAIPTSKKRFDEIMQVYNTSISSGNAAFIGLRDFGDVGTQTGGVRFLDIDGKINGFTMVGKGQNIWEIGQPNNFQNQNCAFSKTGANIEDIACDSPSESICQRTCVDTIDIDERLLHEEEIEETKALDMTLFGVCLMAVSVFAILAFLTVRKRRTHQ